MGATEMDRKKFLDLRSPMELPLCDVGRELAAAHMGRESPHSPTPAPLVGSLLVVGIRYSA
jgi:hypothetical protein